MCIHEIQPPGATYAARPWPWMQVGDYLLLSSSGNRPSIILYKLKMLSWEMKYLKQINLTGLQFRFGLFFLLLLSIFRGDGAFVVKGRVS